jgi:hypothetical protein
VSRRSELAQQAMGRALRIRQRVGVGLASPLNVFDACHKLGVDVRFENLPSMEGFLARTPRPTILISSVRPPGRQVFTCAHELGHFVFQHAAAVDLKAEGELEIEQEDDDEYVADQFAAFLLMPKSAVQGALKTRDLDLNVCPSLSVLALAGWFGVGYMTFVNHLRFGLRLIGDTRWKALKKQRPAKLRNEFFPGQDLPGIHFIDSSWGPAVVEGRVGDGMWFSSKPDESGLGALVSHRGGAIVVATKAGTYSVSAPGLGTYQIRVSRQNYEGRAIFRALPEDEGD